MREKYTPEIKLVSTSEIFSLDTKCDNSHFDFNIYVS